MKKRGWLVLPIVAGLLGAGLIYLLGGRGLLRAESDPRAAARLLEEIEKERTALAARQASLDDREGQLRVYEAELERRNADLQQRLTAVQKQERDLTARIEARVVDRQMIETFESVDPDSAAVLMVKLYGRDAKTAALILRKLSGKKAGKILEAMVGLDPETATNLTRETIDAYKPAPAPAG